MLKYYADLSEQTDYFALISASENDNEIENN